MPAVSKKLTNEESAYIAGFLDGEGNITILRRNQYLNKTPSYGLIVGFTNTDRHVLEWLSTKVAGGIYKKARYRENHRQGYEFRVWNKQETKFILESILPYLRIKRAQAEVALDFLELGRVRKTGTWPLFKSLPAEIELREKFKQALGLLNSHTPNAVSE